MYNYNDNTLYNDGSLMEEFLGGFFVGFFLIIFAVAILQLVATWKIFKKAGKNGWESIIPIYSNYVLFEIVGMKGWYAFLVFVPFVGSMIALVLSIMANMKLATVFGKDAAFGIGLILVPVIFYPMLAFGDSKYTGFGYGNQNAYPGNNTNTGYNPNPGYPTTENPTPVAAPNPMTQNKVHFDPPTNNNSQNNTPGAM